MGSGEVRAYDGGMGVALSENALRVLEARYLTRDGLGRLSETPDELFERVAGAVAEGERAFARGDEPRWRDEYLHLMASLDFLPNSPTLMNAGTALGQLSACFVIPVEDTMEGIFEAVKQMALVQRTGGGTGFSFSRLRPAGSVVGSTGGSASGPVSFMRIFDAATENIRQGGKRRGANMGVLRVDHPDIDRFIAAKLDGESLQNFNISVAATDAFFEAALAGTGYDLVDPHTGRAIEHRDAGAVLDAIAQAAWRTGDPGLLFIDAINRGNPVPHLGSIEATNPCGEVPLLPWEACNLGSINLSRMIHEEDGRPALDRERLASVARTAVRFLDDVIEVNRLPGPLFDEAVRATRKIGLGVMGFAELLAELDVAYDSERAVAVAREVMTCIEDAAFEASAELAEERGPFPAWTGTGTPVRNATRTAIAPTGTIGIIAGTTASIEPLFALAYRRSALEGQVLTEVNPVFLRHLAETGLDADAVVAEVARVGSLAHVAGVPEALRRRFATALEVPWKHHLDIQAAFQTHTDNSVSKTINLPAETTVNDVRDAYIRAWEMGLKGITAYRYGSHASQVLELGAGDEPFHYEYAAHCDPDECRV